MEISRQDLVVKLICILQIFELLIDRIGFPWKEREERQYKNMHIRSYGCYIFLVLLRKKAQLRKILARENKERMITKSIKETLT